MENVLVNRSPRGGTSNKYRNDDRKSTYDGGSKVKDVISKLLDREEFLDQFREDIDDVVKDEDFPSEGNDLDLSYSKFSHFSGTSSTRQNSNTDPHYKLDLSLSSHRSSEVNREREVRGRILVKKEVANREPSSLISSVFGDKGKQHSEMPFVDNSQHGNKKGLQKNYVIGQNRFIVNKSEPREMVTANACEVHLSGRTKEHEEIQKVGNFVTPAKGLRSFDKPSLVKLSFTPAQRLEYMSSNNEKDVLDNFKFISLIGKGAYASVFKCQNIITEQLVAIKQISLDPNQDVRILMGEIDLLKILVHPNIVKYHGFIKTSTTLNIILEYCEEGSLRQLYKKHNNGLSEALVINYIKSVLRGLDYLHEQGVVHRDVKAANVLITSQNEIKLADFGVATKVTSKHYSVVGTPNWMAPETVLGGDGICTASDIWSLGATVIELLTTNPPYSDLNPMATLHSIGTDDHPPLPKNISPLAKDFLLECFQKQPRLRTNAKMLLKHKWLNPVNGHTNLYRKKENHYDINSYVKPIKVYTEAEEENNWEIDFDVSKLVIPTPNQVDLVRPENTGDRRKYKETTVPSRVIKRDILEHYAESGEEFDFDTTNLFSAEKIEQKLSNEAEMRQSEGDPFLSVDIEIYDRNELELQSKIELLVSKLSSRVEILYLNNEEVVSSLIKITGKILSLVKKSSSSHDMLIRDHGILTLLELASNAPDLPRYQSLWHQTLSILNIIFENNILQFENFCLLGGIPVFTHFRNTSYDLAIRLEVAKFIEKMESSERALSMFVSNGGLKVLSKFIEEDFDSSPQFPLVAVNCIHNILSRDITRSKSDLCRILSRYGVLFWVAVLLNRLTKFKLKKGSHMDFSNHLQTVDVIIDIFKYFGSSEAKVRKNISSVDLFKILIKVFPHLDLKHKLTLLNFIRSMSCVGEILSAIYSADMLEFLVGLMEIYRPDSKHFKEIFNLVCPILYNMCYLNHSKEKELVELGAVPSLKVFSLINIESRQFALPILFELIYCEGIENALQRHNILHTYLDLLVDPYWQSNALDSLLTWHQNNPEYVRLESKKVGESLVEGFLLPNASNVESVLENYSKILTMDENVCHAMLKDVVIQKLLQKLGVNDNHPAVQVGLLRVLKLLVLYGQKQNFLKDSFKNCINNELSSLSVKSVLVGELAQDIISHL